MAQKLNVQYIRLYTDGSAARKLAPAAPEKKPAVLPKAHRQRRKVIYLDPVATVGMVVAVCMLIAMAVGLLQLREAQTELEVMQSHVQRLSAENENLQAQYSEGYDLEKIRQTALALDMIPVSQAQQITICVPREQPAQQKVTLWEQLGTFLSRLFA